MLSPKPIPIGNTYPSHSQLLSLVAVYNLKTNLMNSDMIQTMINQKLKGIDLQKYITQYINEHPKEVEHLINKINQKSKNPHTDKMKKTLINFCIIQSIVSCIVDHNLDPQYQDSLFDDLKNYHLYHYPGFISQLRNSGKTTDDQKHYLEEQNNILTAMLIRQRNFYQLCKHIDAGDLSQDDIESFVKAVSNTKTKIGSILICSPGSGNFALPEIGDLLISKKITGESCTMLIEAIAQTEDDAMIQDLIASGQISGKDLRILHTASRKIKKKIHASDGKYFDEL